MGPKQIFDAVSGKLKNKYNLNNNIGVNLEMTNQNWLEWWGYKIYSSILMWFGLTKCWAILITQGVMVKYSLNLRGFQKENPEGTSVQNLWLAIQFLVFIIKWKRRNISKAWFDKNFDS